MPTSALMNVMVGAARKAARSLVRDFGEVEQLQVSVKGPANFVTAADHRAEDIIFSELSKARQAYAFLMEERGEIRGADRTHRWIVDPLDGTTNFLHGLPLFAISIALEREGQLVAGVIYSPVMDELYTAEKGKGAFLNDRRLRVAARRTLGESLLATGIPNRGRGGHARFAAECGAAMRECAGIRRSGAACIDLAWIASGRYDGYWDHNLKPWDMAAGIVLIREAGGMVTDLQGGSAMFETGTIATGNTHVHKQLLDLLQQATIADETAG